MIRHILLIQFKDNTEAKDIDAVRDTFLSIPSKIEGVDDVEWGVNDSPENKNKGYTHGVLMTFADQAGRDNYLVHPEHLALTDIFRPVLDDIIVVDYSV